MDVLRIVELPPSPCRIVQVYSWAVRVEHLRNEKAPDSLNVIDFSRNLNLKQTFSPVQLQLEGYTVDDSQTFNVAFYKQKLHSIDHQYKTLFNKPLGLLTDMGRDGFSEIPYKLVILVSKVQLKMYRNIIQGRNIETTVADPISYSHEHSNLDLLFLNIVKYLPLEFFNRIDKDLVARVIPPQYLARIIPLILRPPPQSTQDLRVKAIEETQGSFSQKLEPGASHVHEGSSAISQTTLYSGSSHSPITRNTQAAQNKVLPDGFIADPEHYSDYEDDDDEEEEEELGEQNRIPLMKHFETASITNRLYSLEELNKVDDTIDNNVYRVNAYIVGSTPEDWSYVCAKTYLPNDSGYSDPTYLNLELIITDTPPLKQLVLTKKNSFTVTFTGAELEKMFVNEYIERSYVSLGRMRPFLNFCDRKSLVSFELYKSKARSGGGRENTVIWTARNFPIRKIITD